MLPVDDHPLFREGLAAAVDLDDDFAVVAAASTGEEALTQAARTGPDPVIMDLLHQAPGRDRATAIMLARDAGLGAR